MKGGASFETAASQPPQDEGKSFVASKFDAAHLSHLILRSARRARLEGRTLNLHHHKKSDPGLE
jgi:hypothetical protein